MSFQNQRRVPFTIPSASHESLEGLMGDPSGYPAVSGLVGLEGDHLVIQVRQNPAPQWESWGMGGLEGLFGMGGGSQSSAHGSETPDVSEAVIPLEGLAAATVKGRWGRTIELSTNDLNHFASVPGARGERLYLKVARKDRWEADRLVHDLQMRLSDLGIAHLDREIARLEGRGSEHSAEGPKGRDTRPPADVGSDGD